MVPVRVTGIVSPKSHDIGKCLCAALAMHVYTYTHNNIMCTYMYIVCIHLCLAAAMLNLVICM